MNMKIPLIIQLFIKPNNSVWNDQPECHSVSYGERMGNVSIEFFFLISSVPTWKKKSAAVVISILIGRNLKLAETQRNTENLLRYNTVRKRFLKQKKIIKKNHGISPSMIFLYLNRHKDSNFFKFDFLLHFYLHKSYSISLVYKLTLQKKNYILIVQELSKFFVLKRTDLI